MGFKGYSSEAEYATQLAVWVACGAVTNITYANNAHGKKVEEIYKWIQKHKNDKKYSTSGTTTLKLKATNVDKSTGTATLEAKVDENAGPIAVDVTLKSTGFVGEDGKPLPSKIKSNTPFKVKLADASQKGSITAATPRYAFFTPEYQSSTATQNTVGIMGVKSGKATDDWSFDKPDTPTPPHITETPIKAMFDLKKNDDEGDQVDQAKFDVYEADEGWSQGDFIGTITTNKNGVARSGELDPGRYIAVERSTGKNLDVDKTPVYIDLTEDNLKQNAKVTHIKTPDGKAYDLYHLDVDGPVNNHKPPKITSLLTNLEDNTKFAQPTKGPVVLNEHLYFSHLVGTVSYNVHAWLMDKATGQPITINGQKIEASKTIGSPNNDTNDDGIEADTDLQLKIPDASSLAGKDIVAYSEIARSDKPDHYTSVHQDINDKNETIHFSKPEIHTNAINKETNGKKLQPTDGETLEDTVTYKELIPGKTYTLKGIVMDKDIGKAVMNDGKKVEFTKTFTPSSANGEVKVEVKFDDHHYRNHRLVVFETLYYTDYFLTDHRDINDVNQSLDVTNPQLHTTLSDNTQKMVSPKAENTVEDVIRYTDLIPGQTYSIRGKLMDQVTGQPVMKRGVPVMETATFKPSMANGTITLTFVFDGTQYVGHHITAFESLYINGRILIEHADLNDASQTVSIDNEHDNLIPIVPKPVIPTPTPGGGVVVNNNNNNNNNNSSNNNSGSNNAGVTNTGSNIPNTSPGQAGNNIVNNQNNKDIGNIIIHNNSNKIVPGNNTRKTSAKSLTAGARKSILPTATMIKQPIGRVTHIRGNKIAKKILPAESPDESLPQTGNIKDSALQILGAAVLVITVGTFVYVTRRWQTTGLD